MHRLPGKVRYNFIYFGLISKASDSFIRDKSPLSTARSSKGSEGWIFTVSRGDLGATTLEAGRES